VIGQRGEGVGEFNFPTFIAFANNSLYVTDTLNSRVQIMTGEGEYQLKFGRRGLYVGDLPRPKGIATDADGRVYVVESYYDHLLVYSNDGQLLLPIGGTGSDVGQFYLPSGVWTDSKNRVYVADMFNGRVVILEYIRNN
jgi:DNA-binding beta-propeller fold protein YncE